MIIITACCVCVSVCEQLIVLVIAAMTKNVSSSLLLELSHAGT